MALSTCVAHWLFPLKYFLIWLLHFRGNRCSGNRKDTLLIRDFQLGDFFYSAGLYGKLAREVHQSGGRLLAVLPALVKPIAERMGCFDEVIYMNLKEVVCHQDTRYRLYEKIASLPVRQVIYLVASRHCLMDYLALAPKAAEVHAFDVAQSLRPNKQNMISYGWTTRLFSHVLAYDLKLSAMENEARLLSRALGTTLTARLFDLASILDERFLPAELLGTYLVVVPGAKSRLHGWPPRRFAEVLRCIFQAVPSMKAVIVGNGRDVPMVDDLMHEMGGDCHIVNLCCKTDIVELCHYIRGARMVLTNDTGTLHVAAHLGVRTFCVLGHGHWGLICPQPLFSSVSFFQGWCEENFCNWNCTKEFSGAFPCVQKIKSEPVSKAMLDYLEGHDSRQTFYRF